MFEKMKKWKLWSMGALGVCALLVGLADTAQSSGCTLVWHEPDCPEELLEK